MKKYFILTIGLFLGMVALSSCGDSGADEKEQARLDSLRNDSIERAIAEQERLDQMLADSIEAALEADGNMEVEGVVVGGSKTNTNGGKDIIVEEIKNVTVEATEPVKTGKDAVKGTTPTTGKDAIKGTDDAGKKGGKSAIKGK